MGKLKEWCDKHYDIYHVDENGNYYDAERDVIVNDLVWRPQNSIKWQLEQQAKQNDDMCGEIVNNIHKNLNRAVIDGCEKDRLARIADGIAKIIGDCTGLDGIECEITVEDIDGQYTDKTIVKVQSGEYEPVEDGSFDVRRLFEQQTITIRRDD